MKTLEIAPLKDKKLTVLIVEKEYNEPFWIIESASNSNSRMLHSLFRPSVGFYKFLENIIGKVKPDFATEELGMRSQEEFYNDNVLAQMFQKEKIPFYPVDIDGNAKAYLVTNLDKKRELRDGILKALDNLSKQKGEETSIEREYLIAYGQCLQLELEEQEREISFPIRESWIVMEILDHAKEISDKKEVTCLYICSPEHVEGIKKLLESLDVRVEVLKLSKKIVSTHAETPRTSELENLLQSMQIQVKPIIGKTSEDAPYLLFYLDTDQKASPFDICMAYDAGYNAVVPYENVTPEDAKRIVQDAIFSRGPKAVKHTCFFIGGKNAEKAEEVFEAIKDTMFPPFKTSIIIDPGGAYTTAAAMVAKVEDAVISHKLGELKGKTCAVLGTGAVGQIAAVLLAKLGCNVMIASINPGRKDGREYAESVSKLLATKYGVKVQGVFAPSSAEKLEIIKKADIILCAGTRGTRVIEKDLLKEVKHIKVIVDINAIPPFGVEGIELKDDMREIMPGIFGIGALTVGDLKHKLEKEILWEARSNGKEVYNYNLALEIARKILQKEISLSKLTLTLSYPPPKKDAK
jgi:methylene-tetrahydromethanopterin dehydrogenase